MRNSKNRSPGRSTKENDMNEISRDWIKTLGAALLTISFLAIASVATKAQDTNDVQELKKQVKQLEKMVEDLNKKITSVEDAQKAPASEGAAPAPAATTEIS